jgi:hypothetical protein
MDFKLIILALGLAFAGCDAIKQTAEDAADSATNVWKGQHVLKVTFQSHRPYCGGAAPTPEMEQGFTEALADRVFYIYEGERPSSVTKMIKVRTDANGYFSIDLKKGVYSIISEDKALTLKEFIEKKKIIDEVYGYDDDSCFEEWYNTPELVVDLSSNEERNVVINEGCFTGDNPCMQWRGPYPP